MLFRKVTTQFVPVQLDPFLKHLTLLCRQTVVHPLPVKMLFIGETPSDRGEPMAIYACPFHGCSRREGWVRERHTGKPFRLWGGFHNGTNGNGR